MTKKKKSSIDRRSFLKNSIIGCGIAVSNPAKIFFAGLFSQYMKKAYSQSQFSYNGSGSGEISINSAISNDFRLINLMITGGAARWMWDLPLKPESTSPFYTNGYVGTTLNSLHNPVYNTVTDSRFNGIQMPALWGGNIPRPGSGSTAMANLAKHMLMIRGVNFLLDSHDLCKVLQLAPENSHSITGLVADNATTGVPAISMRDEIAYASAKGISNIPLNRLSAPNPLSKALEPFTGSSNLTEISNQQVGDAIDNLINLMSSTAGARHEYLPTTTLEKNNAKALMKKSFGDLQQAYNDIHNKYEDLFSRSISDSNFQLEGLEDQVLAGSASEAKYAIEPNTRYVGTNLNNIFTSSTSCPDLVAGLAVAEYMVLNDLSSSVNISAGGFSGLEFDALQNMTDNTVNAVTKGMHFDHHQSGAVFSLLFHTKYFRGLSACLYELTQKLKSKTLKNGKKMFDHTVISVCSDFNRSPRNDKSGSDHGWRGSNYTIISGMNTQCEMVGNITRTLGGSYAGTWGKAAPIVENNNTELIIGNACSTVAEMLEVTSPSPNSHSVVTKNPVTGQLTLALPRGKNV